jgi:hypothetical protein
MNIIQLTNHTPREADAEARAFSAGLRALHAQQHEVLVVTPEDAARHTPGRGLRFVRRLVGREEGEPPPAPLFAPEVVHVHHPFLVGEEALRLSAEQNLPLIFTAGRGYPPPLELDGDETSRLAGFLDTLAVCFANRCDVVIAPGAALAVRLFERGVSRPIHVVPDAETPAAAEAAAGRLLEIYVETLRQRRARGHRRELARSGRLDRELALAWSGVHPANPARARRPRGAFASFRDGAALSC